jgi:hypothetical protein
MTERETCSSRSLALDEPLVGTASRYRHWLLVEQPGRWGHDALVQSGLPPEVGAVLRTAAAELGMRVLLIKRRDRSAAPVRRCFAAYAGVRERVLRSFQIDDPGALLDLDLEALRDTRYAELGDPVPGPILLVCTHGKHDQCCARHGGALYRTLAASPDVWECTHVGGDRFAGNLVALPEGLYFGRVGPGDAAAVAAGCREGMIRGDLYRGRASLSPPAQAAEVELRRHLGLWGVDETIPVRHERLSAAGHAVTFLTPEGSYRVELDVMPMAERPLTCKGAHPHRPRGFALQGIQPA